MTGPAVTRSVEDVRADERARAKVSLREVTLYYPGRAAERGPALHQVSLDVAEQDFVALVGRSGCGKTTLLNLVGGILRPSSGQVLVDGREVLEPGPDRGIVFQHAALFPWLTVRGNIDFALRSVGVDRAVRSRQVDDLLRLVGLDHAADRYPHELSGGMRQRVAIARAFGIDPEVLLMDEPFGALDELTRADMQEELLQLWTTRRKTVLFITHSIAEAVYLSDVIHVVRGGRIAESHRVDLPRPRVRHTTQFLELVEAIHHGIG